MMSSVEIGLLILLTYLCIHGIVNRISKCIENCYLAKYYKGEVPNINSTMTSSEKEQNDNS